MNRVPPITSTFRLAGSWRLDPLVVVLEAKVGNQILSAHPTQGVLQLHQLNENVVLGIQSGSRHGSFEVEGQPLLDAFHARPLRQIQKQNQIQHQGSGQYGIAAQEVDFDLHGITQPSEDVDVVPTFLGVAAWRIVIDANRVIKVLIKLRVQIRLQNLLQHA